LSKVAQFGEWQIVLRDRASAFEGVVGNPKEQLRHSTTLIDACNAERAKSK
jgi:hypothetical protein